MKKLLTFTAVGILLVGGVASNVSASTFNRTMNTDFRNELRGSRGNRFMMNGISNENFNADSRNAFIDALEKKAEELNVPLYELRDHLTGSEIDAIRADAFGISIEDLQANREERFLSMESRGFGRGRGERSMFGFGEELCR